MMTGDPFGNVETGRTEQPEHVLALQRVQPQPGDGQIVNMQVSPLDVRTLPPTFKNTQKYPLLGGVILCGNATYAQLSDYSAEDAKTKIHGWFTHNIPAILPTEDYPALVADEVLTYFDRNVPLGGAAIHVSSQHPNAGERQYTISLSASDKLGQIALELKKQTGDEPAALKEYIRRKLPDRGLLLRYRRGQELVLGYTQAQYEALVLVGSLLCRSSVGQIESLQPNNGIAQS